MGLDRCPLGSRAIVAGFGRVVRLVVADGHGHCILAPEAARSRMSVLRWISAGPSAGQRPLQGRRKILGGLDRPGVRAPRRARRPQNRGC